MIVRLQSRAELELVLVGDMTAFVIIHFEQLEGLRYTAKAL